MGLDLCFNRKKAVDAGLILTKEVRGTPEEIAAVSQDVTDIGYYEWLKEEAESFRVPGTDIHVEASGDVDLFVRANTWGRVYKPLTDWLRANNIEWSEA